MQLGNITTAAGAVSVPLTVSGFNNVGSVLLKIDYNASSLSFSSVTTTLSGVSFTAAASNGVLSISWFDQSGKTPIPITSGTLLTLNFTFNGVASSLAFDTVNSEISNDSGVKINGITYSNGSIQGSVSNPTVTLVNTPGAIDSVVSVPLTVQNFSNIGAISLKIAYNSSALSFVSISNAPAGRNFTASAANGILSISWFDQSTDTPMNFANQTLLDVNFKYNGGNGSLSFNTTSCQISNESGVALTNVVYVNGAVSSAGPAITIANVISPIGTVIVPVTVTKMSGIGAISLVIDYNASLLTNATLINPYSGLTFTSNAKNGEFLVSWFDQSGGNAPFNADSAVLFDLSFNYTGGTDPLSFDLTQSQFATGTGTILNNVTFNNGSVKLGSAPTLSLPNATAVLNNSVSIPVSFKQFKAIGAISLKIQYNASVLNFTGITNVPGGKTFTYNESNGIITLSWFDQTGGNSSITADSATLVNLNFVYLGGSTSLTFLGSASQVADSAGDVIAGVVFINGSVSVINSVITHSGIPKVYALSQNYPNPFNPSTNINFDLPKESKVVLKVYNILGQEVATLVNRAMVAGSYTFQFTDKNLSSGIYIYRLQAGDFTLTKKMTLLK